MRSVIRCGILGMMLGLGWGFLIAYPRLFPPPMAFTSLPSVDEVSLAQVRDLLTGFRLVTNSATAGGDVNGSDQVRRAKEIAKILSGVAKEGGYAQVEAFIQPLTPVAWQDEVVTWYIEYSTQPAPSVRRDFEIRQDQELVWASDHTPPPGVAMQDKPVLNKEFRESLLKLARRIQDPTRKGDALLKVASLPGMPASERLSVLVEANQATSEALARAEENRKKEDSARAEASARQEEERKKAGTAEQGFVPMARTALPAPVHVDAPKSEPGYAAALLLLIPGALGFVIGCVLKVVLEELIAKPLVAWWGRPRTPETNVPSLDLGASPGVNGKADTPGALTPGPGGG